MNCIKARSDLLFGEFLWAKSSHFNRNPRDQEFHVRVKDFPIQNSQWVQVGHGFATFGLKEIYV